MLQRNGCLELRRRELSAILPFACETDLFGQAHPSCDISNPGSGHLFTNDFFMEGLDQVEQEAGGAEDLRGTLVFGTCGECQLKDSRPVDDCWERVAPLLQRGMALASLVSA